MKLYKEPTLADSICDLRTRKIKSKLIDKDYSRGESATGKPSYDGVLLFRMCLLTYVPSVHAWKYMKYTPS
jgi:IS5 family transposase